MEWLRRRMERLRWQIVYLVEKLLPGQCWSRLVDWVLFDPADRRWGMRRGLPFRRIEAQCRADAARVGCCYCGKLRRDGPR